MQDPNRNVHGSESFENAAKKMTVCAHMSLYLLTTNLAILPWPFLLAYRGCATLNVK